jgi:hypothetical protein
VGREWSLGITFHTPESVMEWTHTFLNGLLLWELEFKWTPESS